MRTFKIETPDGTLRPAIQTKTDNLNKPKGSLGRLEELAMQVCLVQQTLEPTLAHPCHLLLGGDHGIEREGVSVSPREVTWQQMINFTRGGGGVNMFCRQHGFKLRIVDVGVDYDFKNEELRMKNEESLRELTSHPLGEGSGVGIKSLHELTSHPLGEGSGVGIKSLRELTSPPLGEGSGVGIKSILDRKIRRGTRNFLYEPAMTGDEFDRAVDVGADLVDDCIAEGCRVLSIGEMGIGNTSPSSIWMHLLGGIPLNDCIGAGAGLDTPGIRHKREVLTRAVTNYRLRVAGDGTGSDSRPKAGADGTEAILSYFGGYEMIAAVGAMLRAAERHLIVLIDGFIMTACALAAIRLYPASKDYMIFTHCGDESGHRKMLDIAGAKPLLSLGLRLGEGTGALCAFPIVDSAVRMINEMNNFNNAGITKYF